ncbi:hypothetical protein SAMN05421780_101519 [Flexibacter flexilis DSM 6793]|uniref:Uncharacterized protein n=1 Tax=Flexibacter flexilis DSM 6793 TaxID=927664 RepID=A0A1I1DYR3_9BACT|nr:hypothetical protein SAMN05421780_101519 [Flexibacter flexilis DSM 6793]
MLCSIITRINHINVVTSLPVPIIYDEFRFKIENSLSFFTKIGDKQNLIYGTGTYSSGNNNVLL